MMDGVPMDLIVIWHVSGYDAYGKPAFAVPARASGWWEDSQEEFVDQQNRKQMSRAVIDLFGFSGTLSAGDMVASGLLYDFPSGTSGDPTSFAGAVVVRQVLPNRDFRRREVSRTLYL